MAINVNLTGADLAQYLAVNLSELEFELLMRERIKREFDGLHLHEPNLSESYNSCTFMMSWADESSWRVAIGENYSRSAEITGQVLGKCVEQVLRLYHMKGVNKLSRLLPAPRPIDDC